MCQRLRGGGSRAVPAPRRRGAQQPLAVPITPYRPSLSDCPSAARCRAAQAPLLTIQCNTCAMNRYICLHRQHETELKQAEKQTDRQTNDQTILKPDACERRLQGSKQLGAGWKLAGGRTPGGGGQGGLPSPRGGHGDGRSQWGRGRIPGACGWGWCCREPRLQQQRVRRGVRRGSQIRPVAPTAHLARKVSGH